MRIGDTIMVKEGWGYNIYDPMGFSRSDGTVMGIVTGWHENPNTFYFRLEDGRIASTAISGVEVVTETNGGSK
jgi:hypothetical protein